MQGYTIRDAKRGDLVRIVDIYNSTIASRLVTADTEPQSVDSKMRWFDEHNSHSRPLWVVQGDSHEVVAWVSFQSFYGRPAYDATAEISIYLSPEHRGRGLGDYLLRYSIEKAPLFGVKTLLGFIFSHNEPSINLFKKNGFEQWALLPNIAQLDGIERSLAILGKRVG
ncbi:MAG: GNAT family N-acetyltransferase [Bacteroidales bacterium]